MINMSFLSFIVLLVIAVAVAAIFHYAIRYRYLEGFDSFLGKIVVGWLGGWIGSPALGHWWFMIGQIYVIPAIMGAVAAVFSTTLCWKARAKSSVSRPPA